MKFVLAAAATIALFSVATLPAEAISFCSTSTTQADSTPLPPQCALPETKVNHPKWYREGGYCAGAAGAASQATVSHSQCFKITI
jgi:hypothetical protein